MPAIPTNEHYRFLKRACELASWRTDRSVTAIDYLEEDKWGLQATDEHLPLAYDGATFRSLTEDLKAFGYIYGDVNQTGGFWVTQSGINMARVEGEHL